MLLPGHIGGLNFYQRLFCTGADSCDLGQQADLFKKIILGTKLQLCHILSAYIYFVSYHSVMNTK